jgi:hypothetical protein
MKSRPPGPAAHEGKERAYARIDTSLQGHRVSLKASQIPAHTRA